METKTLVLKLIDALSHQDFSFSEKVTSSLFLESYEHKSEITQKIFNYLHELDMRSGSVSYDHIDKAAFQKDLSNVQNFVNESMLFAYGYKSGNLSIVGIMFADSLSDYDIQSVFSRLDNAMSNTMSKHAGQVIGGNKGGTWGTMMLIFSDHNKAQHFNDKITSYYESHFFKSTYTSAMSIDCSSDVLTQGKNGFGMKWQGGIDVNSLKKEIWG